MRMRVQECLAGLPAAVLAISGGLDSMVLLDVAARAPTAVRRRVLVATYDHGTGLHATRGAALVAQRAGALGLPVVVGHADAGDAAASEEAWRSARWGFLSDVAERAGGAVVTAHTRDDQIETVLMRLMRGAGARGLAGLRAETPVRRPLLDARRADLARYAAARELAWVEDPSNRSRRYFRNRVRLDLLPALRRVRPDVDALLLDIGERAAAWRGALEELLDRAVSADVSDGRMDVAVESVAGYSRQSLSILWPALAARAGVVLDRRGTSRLAAFTVESRTGARIQLSGGWEVARVRNRLELRPLRETAQGVPPSRGNRPARSAGTPVLL